MVCDADERRSIARAAQGIVSQWHLRLRPLQPRARARQGHDSCTGERPIDDDNAGQLQLPHILSGSSPVRHALPTIVHGDAQGVSCLRLRRHLFVSQALFGQLLESIIDRWLCQCFLICPLLCLDLTNTIM